MKMLTGIGGGYSFTYVSYSVSAGSIPFTVKLTPVPPSVLGSSCKYCSASESLLRLFTETTASLSP